MTDLEIKMTKYNGKNNTKSSIQLAFDRAKFRSERMTGEEKVMKDFTAYENHHYGRIDPLMNPVYLSDINLKNILSKRRETPIQALNFVVDAFEKVKSRIQMATIIGNIPSNLQYLSNPLAYSGFQDPKSLYRDYMKEYFENFNNVFLADKRITTFDEYYQTFYNYLQTMGVEYPLTFSAFQRSKYSNIFTTGLAISIADLSVDQDQLKEDFFMSTPCFEFYKKICLNNGFYISKNSPWVLVANILSPSLSLYTKKYNLSTKKQIFFVNYRNCINIDLELLINNLLIYYNIYYNNKTYYKDIDICNNKSISNIVLKEPINIEYIDNKYTDDYMYDLYITARNIEEYYPLNQSQLKDTIKKAKNFHKLFDKAYAIGYINNIFRNNYKNRPGGLNDIIRKIDRRANDISDT